MKSFTKRFVGAFLAVVTVCAVGTAWADVEIQYDAKTYKHYTWLPSSSQQKILIQYGGGDAGGQTNINFVYCNPLEGETIRLRGDDLKFADGKHSYIIMQGWGTLVIENNVKKYSSTYLLDVKPYGLPIVPTNTYSGALVGISGAGSKVFEGKRLDDYDPIAATQSASALPSAAEMRVVQLYRGYDEEGRLFKQFQFQCGEGEVSGSYKYVYRIVKVRLTQVGEDIYARVISAYNVRCGVDGAGQPWLGAGFDVDTYRVGTSTYVAEPVACRTAGSAEGYGIDNITLVRTKLPTVRFEGNVSVASGEDAIKAVDGARVEYASRSWIGSKKTYSALYTGTIKADENSEAAISGFPVSSTSLTVNPNNYVSGRLWGSGTFTLLGEDPLYTYTSTAGQPITSNEVPYEVFLCTTNAESTVVCGAEATIYCTKTNNVEFFTQKGETVTATMYHLKELTGDELKTGMLEKGDKRYRMQFQAEVPARTGDDVYVICNYLDVEVNTTTYEVFVGPPRLPTKADGTTYRGSAFSIVKNEASGYKKGMDFDTVIYGNGATHYWDSSSFKLSSGLKLNFTSARTGEASTHFSWTDQLARRTSGTICVRGTTNHYPVYNTYGGGLLTNQVFEIGPYGAMAVNPNGSVLPSNNRTFNVYQGGEIRLASGVSFTNVASTAATVIGGSLRCGVGSSSGYDCGGYGFQRVMLKDGADIVGLPMRVGNQTSLASVSVAGETPSRITAGYCIAGAGQSGTVKDNWSFLIAVADVTGDAGADLIVDGTIKHYATSSWTPGTMPVYKKGEGTVLFNAVTALNDNWPVSIDAGTWKFGANDVAQGNLTIKLNGGAVASAADTTNVAGPLILSENSSVVLDAGATLTFADSSAQTWESGKLLAVTIPTSSTGALQATLKFAGPTRLTRTQLHQIRINGDRADITDDGTIVPRKGLMLIVR